MKLVELSDDEIEIIRCHRELVAIQKRQKQERKECHHVFVYEGHGHNYDIYKCNKCGDEEEI